MKIKQVKKYFKGNWRLAAICTGMTSASFYGWEKSGKIPYASQCVIQVKTGGELMAREEDA